MSWYSDEKRAHGEEEKEADLSTGRAMEWAEEIAYWDSLRDAFEEEPEEDDEDDE